jgi:hypothetical protein
MVVVSTMREPGIAGFADDEMVHELIPTVPSGTVVDVVVLVVDVVDVVELVVVVADGTVVTTGATVVDVVELDVVEEVEVVEEVDVVDVDVSMVTGDASAFDVGPLFPAESETAFAASRATTVPSLAHVTETVMVLPELALGVNTQPVAVPASLLKSLAAMLLTDSLNARV